MKLFMGMHLRPLTLVRDGRLSGVQHDSVGVAKLSVERGFLVLRVDNWGRITVRYTE